ncbi:MAG: hypothetical protein JNL39_13635 [Opitutaceae bacterium]|nr:hypothetical protein [Opitutaceae bacterium]
MISENPKRTSWSKRFFVAAAIAAGVITFQIAIGETPGRRPREIDRVDALAWFFVPMTFWSLGYVFLARERRAKNPRENP